MMVHERAHMQTARKELEALRTAHDASLLLHDVAHGPQRAGRGLGNTTRTAENCCRVPVGNLASIFAGRHGDHRLGLRAGGDGTQAPDW